MVSKRFLVIIASVIIAWLLLNGMNYRLISSFNQINEDVVSIYDSISTASLLQYKIVNFYMEMGRFPISNEELGIGAPETFNRRATSKITIGPEGIIEVSLKDIVDEKASIFLKPYLSYTGIGSEIDWQCFSYTVTQDHFDHGPLSQSCVYRQNNLPPPPPSQPSWAVTNSENFILAIHRKRRAVILRMLREGIDVNTPVNDELPMQAAIDENDYKIAKILIDAGADTNALLKNKKNMSLLMYASARKNASRSLIDMLLKKNTDFTLKDSEGRTVLMYAAMGDNHYLTKLLIEAGVNIDTVDNYGKTAAAYALENGGANSSSYRALMRKQDLNAEFIYVLPDLND
ncbi:MAG: ankyrin repeat domain-containing protein [Gammaproteobacteria bacterium]|jgi:hypothetical protein|nr:ankyrin repeat domain-containing protein [Gammaproteobacteria bacterium]